MRNSELESRTLSIEACEERSRTVPKLVLLCLTLGCQGGTDASQALPADESKTTVQLIAVPPPPLPQLPKPSPIVGRPPNMPCWLVVKHALPDGEYDNRGVVYNLSYGLGGRLESATQQSFKSFCADEGEEHCVEIYSDPSPRLLYQYDSTTGRLSGVTATLDGGRIGQMSLNYDTAGQLDRYEWTEQFPGGKVWRAETTLAYDGTGRPAARMSKGKMVLKNKVIHGLELSRLEGTGGPFSPKTPIVWPDSPSEVFIGSTFRETLGKVEGSGTKDEEEYVWVGNEGQIRNSTYKSRGKAARLRVFAYECMKEGNFKRVSWEPAMGELPDPPAGSGALLPNRSALLGR